MTRLTPATARKLSGFLRSKRAPEGTLTLNQLKGYLFCICTTPELLQPSFWLPHVFGCHNGIPEFSRAEDVDNIESIMNLYNQVNAEVLRGNPRLPGNCTLDKTISHNFRPGSVLHEWSWGFDHGLSLTLSCWEKFPLDDLDLGEEVGSLWTLLSFFANEQRARSAKLDTPQTPPFGAVTKIVREQLPWLIKDYAEIGRSLYESAYFASQGGADVQEPGVDKGNVIPLFDQAGEHSVADALIDSAYDASSAQEAVALARQALDMDPGSVDALLLLAEWAAPTPADQIDFLRRAVNAAEHQFDPDYIEQNEGHFWGLVETRPYMQALTSLATAYRENKQPGRATELLERTIQLNPHDNQGNRFLLITLYLEQKRYDSARALLNRYAEDHSAFMRYSQLLLDYIAEGDSPGTRKQRQAAKTYNKHVPQYLSGRRKLPPIMPDYYGLGDKHEAILYAADNRRLWRQVVGAIPWLLK